MSLLVVGDIFLDKYCDGNVNRVSPEAPVPVLEATDNFSAPGGAANVACNAAANSKDVTLIGMIGDDHEGAILKEHCQSYDVKTLFLIDKKNPTHCKLRFISGIHQLLRVDIEKKFEYQSKALINKVRKLPQNYSHVIISDYAKGLFNNANTSKLIDFFKGNGVVVIVDPKDENKALYRNASMVTPNLREFETWVGKTKGDEDVIEKARLVIAELNLEYILITLGADGMILVGLRDVVRVASSARHVYDVTGAGDTFVAILGACLSDGISLKDSVVKANRAAAVAVEKFGTSIVKSFEINDTKMFDSIGGGLHLLNYWREQHDKIVMTNGCFDLLHSGHLDLLEKASKFGTKLVVVLNSDSSIKKLKGDSRPVRRFVDRAKLLSSLDCVDLVIGFDEATPATVYKKFAPDILVKGGDYLDNEIVGANETKNRGGSIEIISLVEGHSTTALIKKILEKNSG